MTIPHNAPNFDMEGLKTFFTVAKCKSFSEAAEHLHKTPAAISYRIRTLEDQIGMPLFKRSTRNVELLPSGEHLLEYATQIYGLLQEIPKNLEQLALGTELEYVITINNLLHSPEANARLLVALHERFPYTHFTIQRAVYMGVWDTLLNKSADFAIGVPSWHPISNDFQTLPIGQIEWIFVCSPDHPVSKIKSTPLPNSSLQGFTAINVLDTSVTLRKRTAWLLNGQRELVVPNMSTKLACHLAGLGVGFLPERECQDFCVWGGYSRGSPTRLPFVFEMQYARPDALAREV